MTEDRLPTVSFVIATHNRRQVVLETLSRVIQCGLDRAGYEIILVDNNSTDRTAEIARGYPQLKLLCESKVGPYAARNRGVAAAQQWVR